MPGIRDKETTVVMEYFLYPEKSRNVGKTSDLRLRFQIKISVQPHKFIMHTAMVSATSRDTPRTL